MNKSKQITRRIDFMSKKLLMSFLAGIMVLSLTVFAGEASAIEPMKNTEAKLKVELNEAQKEELKQFLKEVKLINESEKSRSSKKANVLSLSKKEDKLVLEAYNTQISQELQDAIDSFEEVTTDLGTGTTVTTQERVLSDGSRVVYVAEDTLLETEDTGFSTLATVNVSYGSRSHTGTYYFYSLAYPDPVFKLITFYNASKSSGLTATSTSTAGTSCIFPFSIGTNGHSITDSRAATPGTDINTQADFTLASLGINGIGLLQTDVTLRTTIKLNSLGSTAANITYSTTRY